MKLVALSAAMLLGISSTLRAATFTVTNANNSGPGTLRQALLDANSTPGSNALTFNIPGSGVVISPLSALPTITNTMSINGATQPGYVSSPLIEINGTSAGSGVDGLKIMASNCTVAGLSFTRFSSNGLNIITNGNNLISQCYFGIAPDGTTVRANTFSGVYITNSPYNQFYDSIMSGNSQHGVHIGGSLAISNYFARNLIGLDAFLVKKANSQDGVHVNAPRNSIGDLQLISNYISGNNGDGVEIVNAGSSNNIVSWNVIGLDDFLFPTATRPNGGAGVNINGAPGNLIANNVISGNTGDGIDLTGANASLNQVLGNFVGVDLYASDFGNGGDGIQISSSASTNAIGSVGAGNTNTIAYNGGDGVSMQGGTNNSVRGNYIFLNTGLGIDLGTSGVTANDSGDPDTGANQLQNFPILSAATNSVASVTIAGSLNSRSNSVFQIDFYANEVCDPSGNGEGQTYLGSLSVTTAPNSNVTFLVTLPTPITGRYITATATDANGNTSEFSPCLASVSTIAPATFVVTNINEYGPGSLAEMIQKANASIASGPDTITFDIPGSGVRTIAANFHFPAITDPVIIDGYTQTGASTNTLANGFNAAVLIQLDGVNAGAAVDGLVLACPSNVVRGLAILKFKGNGIAATNGGGNRIEGNLIVSNLLNGIWLAGTSDNQIGGLAPFSRNVIATNLQNGIRIEGTTARNNVVQGNFIGVDVTASLDRGNVQDGVSVISAPGNLIGGTASGAGNVIAGNNGDGIELNGIGASNNIVQGNLIGCDVLGANAIANTGAGINISSAVGSTVGGTNAGAPNVVWFNGGDGVTVSAGTNNAVRANSIFSNGGLGIDLGTSGVTANDSGDGDTGANQLQNFPIITNAFASAGNTFIAGTLNSRANATFDLDFFSSGQCDASGNGEGRLYLGSMTVTTDAGGNASFSVTFPVTVFGRNITATATDARGNTSEFSPCFAAGSSLSPVTFTVVNTSDGGPGSLRDAIMNNNNQASSGANTILFDIPGPGPFTITPAIALPLITETVFIDGYSQPGSAMNTLSNGWNGVVQIIIDSPLITDGLVFTTGGNTVRGLCVTRFTQHGLMFSGGDNNVLQGNLIGISPAGVNRGNYTGVTFDQSSGNLVGGTAPSQRNVIAFNNNGGGLMFLGAAGSHDQTVQGNFIGTGLQGTNATSLAPDGVGFNSVLRGLIGGTTPGARNIIAGGAGLVNSGLVTVQGNYFGVSVTGTNRFLGLVSGVSISGGSSNIVGGITAAARNVLSTTISIFGGANTVKGNYIGVDVTGTNLLGGADAGISISSGYSENIIGGTEPGAGNLIAGFTYGILINTSGTNYIRGNFIGTDPTGMRRFGNIANGIHIVVATGNIIGGINPGEANLIAYNRGNGVYILSGSNNVIRGNSIYANTNLAIDLGPAGVTANDVGDGDSGQNQLQNFPVLTGATNFGNSLTIAGTLSSATNKTFTLDFYAQTGCDNSGYGEGQQYLGSTSVMTGADGTKNFLVSLGGVTPIGDVITATATDASGNTSEFSACQTAVPFIQPTIAFTVLGSSPNQQAKVSWPSTVSGFHLQTASNLNLPIFWSDVTNSVNDDNTNKSISLSINTNEPMRFFRLVSP